MDLLLQSGLELGKLIRHGQVSATEVVEAHIQYANKINPKINALTKDRFALARQEAKAVDGLIKNSNLEHLSPYLGVPGTIKECFALAGFPQTTGLVSRKNIIATKDAAPVKLLRDAGIIPIGTTNTPELCMWIETYNHLFGRTNNPYDLSRTVGGSSGGEGAIIGSGASPLGLGSDIGGSLRFPAFYNGIFSHKSSIGLVSNDGHFPVFEGRVAEFLSTGPMARKAEDLFPLLKILSDNNKTLIDPNTVALSKLNVISVESNHIATPSNDLIDAQRKVVSHLSALGATCKTMNFDKLKKSYEIFTQMMLEAGGFRLSKFLGDGKDINLYMEMVKCVFGLSNHIFPVLFVAMQEDFLSKRKVKQKYVEMGKALKQEFADVLGDNGVLLFPTFSRSAPKHHVSLLLVNHWTYAAIFNVLQMPVTQVPLGLNSSGLPLGLQVVTKHGNDHLSIAIALQLEKEFGGWVPPSLSLV